MVTNSMGKLPATAPAATANSRLGHPSSHSPLIRHGNEIHAIGLSAAAPGGYAEQVLAQEALTFPVPNGLTPDIAALTEPVAIGWHAVRRSQIKKKDVAVVVGCGPVGLAVISVLKAHGVVTVIGSDLSAGRRKLAAACGADVVVDPREQSPFADSDQRGYITTVPAMANIGLNTMNKLTRLPVPWQHIWRAAEVLGVKPKRPVVFECVGIPGMIDSMIAAAPLTSRIVVVGVCATPDTIRPVMAINKEIDLRFVVGYTPLEFRDTLHQLAHGKINAAPLVTGTVGLEGVENAFDALSEPETQAKILVDPRLRPPNAVPASD